MSLYKSDLARHGFNTAEAHILTRHSLRDRQIYLKQELDAVVNHVLEDSVVSHPYYYQKGEKGEILSLPSKIPLIVDEEERGGLYNQGINQAINIAMENPQKVVYLYSPPGRVVFDNNPNNKYREFKPYDRGQLNIMFFDGQKICNVSIMISTKKGEEWLSDILGEVYEEAEVLPEIPRISHFITHPKLAEYDIDQLLDFPWSNPNRIIFRNRSGRDFSLVEALSLVRTSFAGKLKLRINTFDKTIAEMERYEITEEFIRNLYMATYYSYMKQKGLDTLPLGGGCGGTIITRFSIENLSTVGRFLMQSEQKDRYSDYNCPNCGYCLQGELRNDRSSWKKECPHCHQAFSCQN